jgi:hypothetical protein
MGVPGYQLNDLLVAEVTRKHQFIRDLGIDPVLVLHEFVRTVDTYWFGMAVDKTYRESNDARELGYLISDGWPMLLPTLLKLARKFMGGFPLYESSDVLANMTSSHLEYLGRIHMIDKFVQLCRSGIVEISLEGKQFRIEPKTDRIGLETLDQDSYDWFRSLISMSESYDGLRLQDSWPKVKSLMERMVFPWKEHFIGYSSTSELDRFFDKEAFHYASQNTFGWDMFPESASFGGIIFRTYRDAVYATVTLARKHMAFCALLLSRCPHMNPRNLVSAIFKRSDVILDLSLHLGISRRKASQLIDVMSSPTDLNADHSAPRNELGPWPLYVPVGDEWVIRSIGGCLYNPFWFLARNLKRLFPEDYDSATRLRENVFRKDLNRLFDAARFTVSQRNVNLPGASKVVTDLDALIYDHQTDTLAIFQLKWLDPFGASMKERRNRASEFYDKSTKWIKAVLEWFETSNHMPVATALGLPPKKHFETDKVLLFVLGRTSGNFSGTNAPDQRAAWGNWYEFAQLVNEHGKDLHGLHHLLQSKRNVNDEASSTTMLRLADYEIVIELPQALPDGLGI